MMINSSSSQKEDDLEVDESGAYYKFNKKMNENKNNFYEDKMNTNVRLSSESDGDSASNASHVSNLDVTGNSEEEEEKQRLIERVLELQSTLEDLSKKVCIVKEENLKLKSENEILGNYIDNLMRASSAFQTTWQHSNNKQ